MTHQQLNDLFLAVDNLIGQRINNPNDTFEQFTERRDRLVEMVRVAMKIERDPQVDRSGNGE